MMDVSLRIDHVVVELADRSRASEVERALRAALERLAQELLDRGHVFGADALAPLLVELGKDAVTAEDLLAPGGPEQLARALFDAVERSALTSARLSGGQS